MHICDYLLNSTCDYEKNKKVINAINRYRPESCEPDIHHISEKLARCRYWQEINRRQSINLGGKFRVYHQFCRISDHHNIHVILVNLCYWQDNLGF